MKKVLLLALALVMVVSCFACTPKPDAPADAAGSTEAQGASGDLVSVKYVVPRTIECLDDAHVWCAIEMGYFKEEGLDVSVEQSTGTTDVKMVTVGQAEFCIPSPINLIIAHEAGMNLKSVFQCDTTQIYGICVRADSDIVTPADLVGKTVVLGDASWQPEFEVFLHAAKIDPSTVNFVVGGDSRAQMVDMGQADAVYTWEKEYQLWMAQGLNLRYISFQDIYPACANSICVTEDMIASNPDLIVKFCRAYAKGILFCKANPEAAADIIVKTFPALNLTRQEAYPAIEGLVNITNDASTVEHGYGWHDEYEWQLNKEGGLITNCFTEDLPVTHYYTNEFVEAINDFDYESVINDAKSYKLD